MPMPAAHAHAQQLKGHALSTARQEGGLVGALRSRRCQGHALALLPSGLAAPCLPAWCIYGVAYAMARHA